MSPVEVLRADGLRDDAPPVPFTSCPAGSDSGPDDAPLTAAELAAFFGGEAKDVVRRFLGWAESVRVCRADALDVVQDAALALTRRVADGSATRRDIHPGRLFRAAMYKAMRTQSASGTVVPQDFGGEREAPRSSPQGEVRAAMLAAVEEFLAPESKALSRRDWLVLTLYYREGVTRSDIARDFGITPANAGRALVSARRRLGRRVRAALLRRGFSPGDLPDIPT